MCAAHATVRGILGGLASAGDKVTVTDMEAGLEHLSRGTTKSVDVMLVIVEPYYKSLETANRINALATELGIEGIHAVANKVKNPADEGAIKEFCNRHNLDLVAIIPYDESLVEADKMGRAPIDYDASSEGVVEIVKLAQVLKARR